MLLFYCSRCIIILSLKNGWVIMRRKTIDTIPVLPDAMKTYYLLFQKAVSFRQDWSKEPTLSCLRHSGNSTSILYSRSRSGFIIIMLPLGAAGSSRHAQSCGRLKWTPRCPACFYAGSDHADHWPCLLQHKSFLVRSKPVGPPAVSGRN